MSFATAEDVATRLGRSLTPTEAATAEMLLAGATAVIADAAGKSDQWADSLEPVPQILSQLAVELVNRVLSNPTGAASVSEQLGAYGQTTSWRSIADGSGLTLTPTEASLVRRAVYGQASASAPLQSVLDDLWYS
jgi:hypothetical protein